MNASVLVVSVGLLGMCSIAAGATFDVRGDVQYRLRLNYIVETFSPSSRASQTPDFQNRYAWNVRSKVKAGAYLLFGVRLSNPSGIATDKIGDNFSSVITSNNDTLESGRQGVDIAVHHILTLPELYFQWTPGMFSMMGGILPVYGNTVLDLAVTSNSGYRKAGENPWAVIRNNSQTGMQLKLQAVDNDVLLIQGALYMALADAPGSNEYDAFLQDKYRFITQLLFTHKRLGLSIMPVVHFIINNMRSADAKRAGHTLEAGFEAKWRAVEVLTVGVGAAFGLHDNAALQDAEDYRASAPLGVLLQVKLRFTPTWGAIVLNCSHGRAYDREQPESKVRVFYCDTHYTATYRQLSFIPRLRVWYSHALAERRKKLMLRPELILKAAF